MKPFKVLIILISVNTCFNLTSAPYFLLPALGQASIPKRQTADAEKLVQKGTQYFQSYQTRLALECWQQALAIYQNIGDNQGERSVLEKLGNGFYFIGDYANAITYYRKNLKVSLALTNRLNESRVLSKISQAYYYLGDNYNAIDYAQKSLSTAHGINRQQEGIALRQLGEIYYSMGDFSKAIDHYLQALSIFQQSKSDENVSKTLSGLGDAYYVLENYPAASKYYQQLLVTALKIRDRKAEAEALLMLGRTFMSLDNAQSGKYFRLSERLDKQNYQASLKNSPDPLFISRQAEASRLLQQGIQQRENGRLLAAIELFQRSLFISQELNDSNKLNSLIPLVETYDSLKDFAKAAEYSRQIAIAWKELGDSWNEARELATLGDRYLELNDFDKAIYYGQQSVAVAKGIPTPLRFRRLGNELSTLGLSLYKAGRFPEAEKILFEGIKVYTSRRMRFAEKVSESDAAARSEADRQFFIYPVTQKVLIAQNKIEAALEIAEQGRARILVNLLDRRLSSQKVGEILAAPPLQIEQMKQVAKTHKATLVEYSIIRNTINAEDRRRDNLDPALYIWVIKPTGEVVFKQVDLKLLGASLPDLVNKARQSLGVSGRGSIEIEALAPTNEPEQGQKELHQLYKLLIEPIATFLPIDPAERVVIIPHGELFLVPFPALQDDNGKRLLENHTILTAPAIQVLALTQQQQVKVQQALTQEAIVVGNPSMPKVVVRDHPPVTLPPLFAAERESIAIAQLLNTKALIGNQARKSAILARLSQARIIHLATHGLLDDFGGGVPGAVPGAIALAPSGTDNLNDGLLTSNEIMELKLNAELVVLSACDTGRGEITGDGVIGLSRSLIIAGVPSIIVSLWSVPDAPTAELMVEFYRNWRQKKMDKAQALRQAMLTTMKTHPNPRDWAAFTLIGEAE